MWRILYLLSENIKTRVTKNICSTEEIQTSDNIRQGKALSRPEFSAFINGFSIELTAESVGARYAYLFTACLLFMDERLLPAENKENLQLLLDATDDFLCKWNLKVNKRKNAIMKFRTKKYNNNLTS